ncbi:DNA replication protein DnaC [Thermosporothrix hazakensis]|jgi:DNA replication protein DnaC|uniref:DNA replication protein DnaC n=1 Tax=Thermosporothrix hazakensis TaxID=644383 RepID=A0A326U811_THEHA|nr:DnaA/Hda family protein [Thermosporothrix hazakensis]PZW29315.1 DNA replication protein DnaC [Thermosporothrix hazakensis]GCE45334.1 hypothetical protein KTH_02030 [Thermosporothrix hazakensis]
MHGDNSYLWRQQSEFRPLFQASDVEAIIPSGRRSIEPPEELFWTCPVCGPMPPKCVPGQHYWIRTTCECEKRANRARQEAEKRQKKCEEMRKRTFAGWLGRQWDDAKAIEFLSSRTFANFDMTRELEAYGKALAFANEPKGNLLLYGPSGTGKTHLAAAICNKLREQEGQREPIASLFASAVSFLRTYRDTRRMLDQTQHIRLMQQAIHTAVLVLDDVDKGERTAERQEIYWMIMDERSKAGRPTVISVNERDELVHYIGSAALSRFSRGLVSVQMRSDDYRLLEEV